MLQKFPYPNVDLEFRNSENFETESFAFSIKKSGGLCSKSWKILDTNFSDCFFNFGVIFLFTSIRVLKVKD